MTSADQFPWLKTNPTDERKIAADQQRLLQFIWSKSGRTARFGCLCFRKRGTQYFEDHSVKLTKLDKIQSLLASYDRYTYDQYFCPNVFYKPDRYVESVCHTRLAWCDIDEADPDKFKPKPSILWQTSPGRTQAIWIWDKLYRAKRAAAFSRELAYRFGGDHGGWAANKLLRLPGSRNLKLEYDGPMVVLLAANFTPISTRPKLGHHTDPASVLSVTSVDCDPVKHDPEKVLRKYGSRINSVARSLARDKAVCMPDRSKQIYMMVRGLHVAGASLDEIAAVIWNSIYFQDKYGTSLLALEREVCRIVAKLEAAK